jgi:hypothetical protein
MSVHSLRSAASIELVLAPQRPWDRLLLIKTGAVATCQWQTRMLLPSTIGLLGERKNVQ